MTDPIRDALAEFDAAVAAELPRVSHVQYDSHDICEHFASKVRERIAARAALSAQPPERVPLSDERIDILLIGWPTHMSDHIVKLIRAVERAHGIT